MSAHALLDLEYEDVSVSVSSSTRMKTAWLGFFNFVRPPKQFSAMGGKERTNEIHRVLPGHVMHSCSEKGCMLQ